MSITFSVKNKKGLFGYQKVLDLKTILALKPNLMYYGKQKVEHALDQIGYCILGVENQSVRGFELHYHSQNKTYDVRVNTPSTKVDWQIALDFIKRLKVELNTIVLIEGNEVDETYLDDFPYIHDIREGVEYFLNEAINQDTTMILYGVNRPFAIDKVLAHEMLKASNMIDEFEKRFYNVQYIDAYSANQTFYKNDNNEVFGVYVLSEMLDTILPYQPYVEFPYQEVLKDTKVAY